MKRTIYKKTAYLDLPAEMHGTAHLNPREPKPGNRQLYVKKTENPESVDRSLSLRKTILHLNGSGIRIADAVPKSIKNHPCH
jgi:hypothetical protein